MGFLKDMFRNPVATVLGGPVIGGMVGRSERKAQDRRNALVNDLMGQTRSAQMEGRRYGEDKARELFGDPSMSKERRQGIIQSMENRADRGSFAGQAGSSARVQEALRAARRQMGSAGIRGGAAGSTLGTIAAQGRLQAIQDREAEKMAAERDLMNISNQELFAHSSLPLAYESGPLAMQMAMNQMKLANQPSGGWLSNIL